MGYNEKKEGKLYEEASGSPMVRTVPREQNATGYTWPICRILLCLLSYWLLTVVNGSRPMSTPRAVVFVLLIVLTWGLFYGVICALVEINIVRKHRRSPKTRQPVSGREKAAGKPFSLEQLAALAEENDIVELRLLHGSRTVTAGSSSDYTPQKGFSISATMWAARKWKLSTISGGHWSHTPPAAPSRC